MLGDATAGVLEDGLADPGIVAAAEVAAHVDPELGVTVVQLRLPPGPVVHDRCCDEVARAFSRLCDLRAVGGGRFGHAHLTAVALPPP